MLPALGLEAVWGQAVGEEEVVVLVVPPVGLGACLAVEAEEGVQGEEGEPGADKFLSSVKSCFITSKKLLNGLPDIWGCVPDWSLSSWAWMVSTTRLNLRLGPDSSVKVTE